VVRTLSRVTTSIRLAAVRRTAGGFQPSVADVRPEAGLREAGLVLINSIPDNGLKASSAFERCHMQPGRPADGPAAVRRSVGLNSAVSRANRSASG
jgi:hypothetical protein